MKFTWRHILWTLASVAAALLAVAVLVAAFVSVQILGQVRNTQLDGTPTGKKLLASSNQIISCTTPGDACFNAGQKRTQDVVASVNRVSIIAAACANRPENRGDVQATQQCVISVLAKQAIRKP